MPPAETPDFDSMSPEEVMAWMESLAKRQGAMEGFTTDANVDIAEVDPDSVQIDEPGYVPYGEEPKKKPPEEKPAATIEPATEAPEPQQPEVTLESFVEEAETLEVAEEEAFEELEAGLETNSMAWLESLAADQTGGFPNMDLEALSAAIEDTEPEAEASPTNPMDWLESLAENQGEAAPPEAEAEEPDISAMSTAELSEIDDPLAAGVDPMLWLESLAKRQGAREDELTTTADMEIDTPEDAMDSGPGYTDYTVESDSTPAPRAQEAEETVDPTAWLDSMVSGAEIDDDEVSSPADVTMDDAEIEAALARGEEISPEQMEQFFNRQLDRGLAQDEPVFDDDYDPDAPPVPAELPSWLLEQVQMPDEEEERAAPEPAALSEESPEPADTEELPDWLSEDMDGGEDLSLESIFETTETETPDVEYDSDDPWVKAFEEEAATNPDEVPEWYERNLNDPQRIAEIERQMGASTEETLEEANLPAEDELAQGEPQTVPAWLSSDTEDSTVFTDVDEEEMPDWLADVQAEAGDEAIPDWLAVAEVDVSPEEIPEWLRETVETDEAEDEALVIPAAEEAIETITPPAPEPVVPVVAATEVDDTLRSAREKVQNSDIEGSLTDYESLIRSNIALDQVVSDLQALAEAQQNQPAVYRVLGDGLMRQGQLQAALDTYRKALNQL